MVFDIEIVDHKNIIIISNEYFKYERYHEGLNRMVSLFERLLISFENDLLSEPIREFDDSFAAIIYHKLPNKDAELLLLSHNYLNFNPNHVFITITIPRNEAIDFLKSSITKMKNHFRYNIK